MYEVRLEGQSERDLTRLPRDVHEHVASVVQQLAQNPRPHGCQKLRGASNTWRVRIGRYRVLYDIEDDTHVVRVRAVLHRKDAYR